ncbi:MAG: CHAD domain-containing protein [Chlorobiaceae bacterium]|nr:CHAD domain-containing protein [Chlorobiaceae bacterium]
MSNPPETLYFRVGENSSRDLPDGNTLPSEWSLRKISSSRERQVFYDTFEEHAFHKGIVVVRIKGILYLTDLDTGIIQAESFINGTPTSFFPSALSDCKAKKMLEQCSDIRSFIRNGTIDVFVSSWKVLDENKKTIAILNSESLQDAERINQGTFAKFFTITPLKGYHRELSQTLKALPEQVDSYRITGFRERFLMIMKEAGPSSRGYSSKFHMQLDGEATIHENIRRLLQFTTSILQLNEHGIRKNIDSEFLHDFRVAVRRTRSILRQLNGVFDPHKTAWFLSGLRELGKRTNELRDCDVYLLRKEEYTKLLPASLHDSLTPFFNDIDEARRIRHKQFCRYLSSADYIAFMDEWKDFIGHDQLPDQEQAPKSALPTKEIAARSIRKAWKKVIVHGRRIETKADDQELHALRIECKKLRYLFEFFSSLLPSRSAGRLIRHLKELQDNLGTFVDISVQMVFLQTRLESLKVDGGNIMEAAAIGGLIASLHREKEKARDHFQETFTGFDNEETGKLFDEIVTSLQ